MAKIRSGFVSNSSSSSFICDICGREEFGFDMCLDEAEMCECENGHTICLDHIIYPESQEVYQKVWNRLIEEFKTSKYDPLTDEKLNKFIEKENIDPNNITYDNIDNLLYKLDEPITYRLPEEFCPLCNFEELDMYDAKKYLLKTTNYTEDEVFEYVKSINKRRRKLRDNEYVEYVCRKLNITTTELLNELDNKFEHSYSKFKKFLNT